MSGYGINVYNENGVVELINFSGNLILHSIDLISSSDVVGEFFVPENLKGRCKVIKNMMYLYADSGDRFSRADRVYFDGYRLSWDLGSFNSAGSSYLNIIIMVV